MAAGITKLADLINPEVMADMISAKVKEKIVVTPFARIDDTLVGRPGDTITVPQYAYIGDAEDIAEGVACGTVKLETSSTQFKVKKAMKAVDLTDEAVLSGYGNPVGETNNQLAKSVASKMDADAMAVITNVDTIQLKYGDGSASIAYKGIVEAIDLFDEEVQSEKVMFVHPKQVTELRKDADFISADKYDNEVVMKGEIGMICGARIVPSKRVPLDETQAFFLNPIVKLSADSETEDETAAVTIYMKRDVNVETERDTLSRKTVISVDEMYGAALTDTSKVVLASFKAPAGVAKVMAKTRTAK